MGVEKWHYKPNAGKNLNNPAFRSPQREKNEAEPNTRSDKMTAEAQTITASVARRRNDGADGGGLGVNQRLLKFDARTKLCCLLAGGRLAKEVCLSL
ncbi:hypothetical protein ZHAS_00010480 [Anopheles sinensis]|uniref:Uncharacterized protein n=1 Tax=Anopheles sinensis TaxID=74873 RepID=A0A084VXP2_ANOSI|nr:hypothetical protein ZHAS_00010480 [Anopheles sinensis]